MLDALTPILQTYTRAFLSQGVGLIGLAWCLSVGQAGFAVLLTILVLTDQAIFLRGRFGSERPDHPGFRLLDGWCVAVSALDVLLCFAVVVRAGGLRSGDGAVTLSPLDSFAYVLACFAHGPTGLTPVTPAGRMAGALVSLLGALAFLAALAAIAGRFRRHA